MAEAGIATEIKESIGRLFTKRRKLEVEKKPEVDRVQAFDNFVNRLKNSEDSVAKTMGRHLEDEYALLTQAYQRQKEKNPELTLEEFLQTAHNRNEGDSRLIPWKGWEIADLERDVVREKRGGMDTHSLFEILGESWNPSLEKRFGRYENERLNKDDGFRFAIKRGEGHANFQSRFASLGKEGEEESGIDLWIKVEIGGPTGDFFMHKGAVRGFALEIPWETDLEVLKKATSQTVS